MDVFAKDVDFVSSWYTVTSLLVGCLPLMGTWDRRRRSIGRFTEMGGNRMDNDVLVVAADRSSGITGSVIEHGFGTLLHKVIPFLPIDGLFHDIDSAMARISLSLNR